MKKEVNIVHVLVILLVAVIVLLCVLIFTRCDAAPSDSGAPAQVQVDEKKAEEKAPDVQPTNEAVPEDIPAATERAKMDTVTLAEYVQKRTVTVNVDLGKYGSSTGSGFFIDDQGTLVTSYHVIEGAQDITVEVSDGGTYNLEKIIDFDPLYDLAVMKINYSGNPYLNICKEVSRTGEDVYAVGSSLGFLNGTFSNGLVSSVSRKIGVIDCIQTTAAISSGNSGGPLVNAYGEVVGVNAFSYVAGENLNLAVDVHMLDQLPMDKNWTINKYREWFSYETDRSYLIYSYSAEDYYLSILHTYQLVTGAECKRSTKEYDTWGGVSGYTEGYPIYVYPYTVEQFDKYIEYLTSMGFVFESKEDYKSGTSYYYVEELHNYYADLYVVKDQVYVSITTD